jgi:acetolactate synthase-1/2/3 large subunit
VIANAHKEFRKLTEQMQIPVITTLMGKGILPSDHPLYLGNLGMHGNVPSNTAISECDVLLSIGTRFNDRITGKISEFAKEARIIHIDIDTASISRNIIVEIPIVADAKLAVEKLFEKEIRLNTEEWLVRVRSLVEDNEHLKSNEKGLTPYHIFNQLNEMWKEAIVVSDVGQNQMWTMQYLKMEQEKRHITSGGLGTMGYGFPAAIGAKLGHPNKTVICITGDGGFQMNLQEMATAVAHELPIIICILNNGYLGMVRQLQELFYDQRYSITCMRYRKSCSKKCSDPTKRCPPYLPDFVKFAESYGALGIRVMDENEISAAFELAMMNTKTPTIIEFVIDSRELVLPMVQSGKALNDMILMEGR